MISTKFNLYEKIVVIGIAFCLSAGRAQGELQRTLLLNYDFETVDATNLFTANYGGVISNTTMAEIGATNHIITSGYYAAWFGMGQASNRIVRMWDSTTNGWATYTASEKLSQGSSVIAALNNLTPGVYYLRFSYDMNRIYENLKIGVNIRGNNGGSGQSGRGNPGDPGNFYGFNSASGGVPVKDLTRDNKFVKCAAEHEYNAQTTNSKYPWRIKIVPVETTPDNLDVFRQGSFSQLDISIWQTNQDGDGAYESDCYFDNFMIEAFKFDPVAPFYLDELLRTTSRIPINDNFTTAYVNYGDDTAPGDGMVELVGSITTNNAATTNYTRSGSSISFAPYVHKTSTSYLGYFGSGMLGYSYPGPDGFNRYTPLWVEGDGQTEPTNSLAYWTLRDQGLASHGFGGHANQFITFDTQKIRSYLLNEKQTPMVITGSFGMSGEVQNSSYTICGGVWVDGLQKFISGAKKRADASESFRIKLAPTDRYITFAVLDNSSFEYGQNAGLFKDVLVELRPSGTLIILQ